MKKTFTIFYFLAVFICSCKINSAGPTFFSGDFIPPKLLLVENMSSTELMLSFSKPISPLSMHSGIAGEEAKEAFFVEEETKKVRVQLSQAQEIGKMHSLHGSVVDHNGNTLSFVAEFAGFNTRVPHLVLSEIRTEYSTYKNSAGHIKYNVEFIELYAQTAGNLAGVTLFNSSDGEENRYYFPAVEVQKGDYIVLHLRNFEESSVDELVSKDESEGTDAHLNAWDFWINATESMLPKNTVIILSERKNGKILDALPLIDSKYEQWNKDSNAQSAQHIFEQGVWLGGWEIEHAVKSENTTVTRTISRQGNLQEASIASKDDWIVVATSNASPGEENSTVPYIP